MKEYLLTQPSLWRCRIGESVLALLLATQSIFVPWGLIFALLAVDLYRDLYPICYPIATNDPASAWLYKMMDEDS